MTIPRSFLLKIRNVSDTFVEKIKAHILCPIPFPFFLKSCLLWGNVEKYCRAALLEDDNTGHALRMQDNQGHIHTLRIYTTYCFSTATIVTLTRLKITFIRVLPGYWTSIVVSFLMNLNSAVNIVTSLWIYVRVTIVRFQAGASHDVQNGSAAHTASIKGYRQIFLGRAGT
jgi:hypothetical protein